MRVRIAASTCASSTHCCSPKNSTPLKPLGIRGDSNGALANASKKFADLTSCTSIAGDGDATGGAPAASALELEADTPDKLVAVNEVPAVSATGAEGVGAVADALVVVEEFFAEATTIGATLSFSIRLIFGLGV